MNALALMMALLGLAYLSSLLRAGRSERPMGLAAGSEWMLFGFFLGAGMLGVVDRAVQAEVEPVLYIAIGWVGLIFGIDYGVVRRRRLGAGRLVLGILLAAVTMAAVAAAAWAVAPLVELHLDGADRWALAIGLGAVASETAGDAVQWVTTRRGAADPLSVLLDDLADAKDAACIVASGVAICLHPGFDLARRLPHGWLTLPAVVIGGGALIGLMAAMMLSREMRSEQAWGLLVGTAMLAAGTTALLRLPVIAALFAVGLALSLVSRHRDRISAMVESTRRGAILPVLLLAGARIDPHMLVERGLLLGAVLVARMVVLFVAGLAIASSGRARAGAPLLGPAMLPAGQLSVTIGLGFALTVPGVIGETVLAAAAVVTVVGELIGPLAFRALLRRTDENGAEAMVVSTKESAA
jgi:Kef-type K+ transport system membrane component KefB